MLRDLRKYNIIIFRGFIKNCSSRRNYSLKFVLFDGDRRLQTCQGIKLAIDHENLESEDSIKYLGVVIHKNLTWNEHTESLIAKVNQTGLLIGCGKKWEILRHFQGKLCGKKGLLCGKLCDFLKADLTLFF